MAFFDRGLISAIAGTVFGVIATLVLTWYFAEKPQLRYYINPVRTSIVRAGQLSELNVTVNGQPITNDLTGVQIAIWNAGKKPIHRSDILKPVILRAANGAQIYKATITKARDVTELTFSQPTPDGVGLDWRILEQNDGAVIQVFYAGDGTVDFSLEGVLEGQRNPVRMTKREVSTWSLIIVFLVLAIIFGSLIVLNERTLQKDRVKKGAMTRKQIFQLCVVLFFLLVVAVFLLLGVTIGLNYFLHGPSVYTPFGF